MQCPDCNAEHEAKPIDPGNWMMGGPPASETFYCDACTKRWLVFKSTMRKPPIFIVCQNDMPETMESFEAWVDLAWYEKEQNLLKEMASKE